MSSTQPLDALSTTAGSNSTEAKGGELVSSSTEQGKVAETGTASADAPASAVAAAPAEESLAAPEADVTADPISSTSAGTTADTTAKSAEGTVAGEADSVGVSAAAETNQLPLVANAPQAGTSEGASSKAAAIAGPATGNDPSASVAETAKEPEAKTKDAETGSEDTETAEPASSASVIAPNETAAASAPATPDKKSKTDDAPAGPTSSLQPSTPAREGRVALILRINKELIRLCVELQSKELATDPVYREAAVRLQANLGYLAGIADKSGKPNDPNRPSAPSAALLKLEPFPRSEHVPSSPLPALYDKLISIFGAARSVHSPTADGKKRSRDSTADLGSEDARKRAASKGIDRSQDVSAAGTPTSSSNMQTGSSQPADVPTATALSNADPSSTSAVPNQVPQQQPQPGQHQPQQQQQPPQQQQPQPQPQQQGKGPDLSLAPPVPIAPPAAVQNIPNNPQAQALMQAFGPNALVNLHALQTHLRGQGTHPWVAFMEANVSGFKAMPLQVQLQHMTSLQNAAQQRQKAMQAGGGGPGSAGPNSGIGSPATMMPNGGMGGAVSSPANTRPVSRHSDSPSQAQASPSASGLGVNVPGQTPGRTGTPLGGQAPFQNRPGSSGSVGSMTSAGGRTRTGSSHLAFDPSQMQSAPSPATMATVTDFAGQQQGGMPFGFQPPGLQQPSPASASSPSQQGQPQQPQQQQQQQGQQGMAPGMMMGGMGMNMPNLQNLPPHLQQQIRQQYMAHLQAQAQAQGMNPQSGFNPQQQQQQQLQQQQGWNFQSPQ
ncbi:hypothetical protein NDA16_003694 [Ustilago loliicola]|nr:hypothetical protein NDA16_003694 [Ustilago loliicola]